MSPAKFQRSVTSYAFLSTISERVKELARGAKVLIRMQGNQTFLDPPESGSSQDTKRATE